MSRLFGPIRQNGYVVRDIEAAMAHWIDVLKVGPWFYIDRVKTDWFRHRGQDSALELSIALANSGDLQIELIQQRNDAPSMYKEFLDSGREGLQHVAFWSTDYQSLYDRALGRATGSATKARSAANRAVSPISIPARRPIPCRHRDRDLRHQRQQGPVLRVRSGAFADLGRVGSHPRLR